MDKLVDLIARNPNHLDLSFYHFSTIFYTFSKFNVLVLEVHVTFAI